MSTNFAAEEGLPLASGLSRDFLLHHRVCPKEAIGDGLLVVAATDDAILSGVDAIGFAYGRPTIVDVVERDVL